MGDDVFEKIINEGIESIPHEFLEKLDNVAITIGDEPTYSQKQKLHLREGMSLFGLYEGVAQNRRGGNYSAVMPDKITIFKNPILRHSRNMEDFKEIVKNVVWHEIAHHFGMNEQEVRKAEEDRRKRHEEVKS